MVSKKSTRHLATISVCALIVLVVAIFLRFDFSQKKVDSIAKSDAKDNIEIKMPEEYLEDLLVKAPVETPTDTPRKFKYIEIHNSCGPDHDGECVNLRSGPGTEYPKILGLRTGMVLKVKEEVIVNNKTWYRIDVDKNIHFPERVVGDWYVSAEYSTLFYNEGDRDLTKKILPPNSKRIVVDLSEEKIYAYDGDQLFMEELVSTGLDSSPTEVGIFKIIRKTPSRYMQGPTPGVSTQYYDLPGVPWNLYFNTDGSVIHGAYWHNKFGKAWSHGCVNLPPKKAKELYEWADIGMLVLVQE